MLSYNLSLTARERERERERERSLKREDFDVAKIEQKPLQNLSNF